MRAPKARPSPFSLPVLHTGSKVRTRTRLPGLALRLLTSAASPAPLSRALPPLPRRTNPGHRTRVASTADLLSPETMYGRPAYMMMSEHVIDARTYPFF